MDKYKTIENLNCLQAQLQPRIDKRNRENESASNSGTVQTTKIPKFMTSN